MEQSLEDCQVRGGFRAPSGRVFTPYFVHSFNLLHLNGFGLYQNGDLLLSIRQVQKLLGVWMGQYVGAYAF